MDDEIIKIELNDELDLHLFKDKDTPDLIEEFLYDAYMKNKEKVVIIHGKGKSQKKHWVHKLLSKNKFCSSFSDAGSNWGRTEVYIKSKNNNLGK